MARCSNGDFVSRAGRGREQPAGRRDHLDDIVDVIEEEAEEDIKALGGVRREEELSDPVWVIARGRFNWLLVNLATAFLASSVLGLFEGELQKMVALAVLAPIVASQGGNAATQTMTVAVRALATRELSSANAGRIILREVLVGLINGVAFAVITGVAAAAWFKVPGLGLVIGLAMMCNSWPRRSAASWFRSCSTASTPIPRSPRGVRHHGDGRGRVLLVPRHRRAVVRSSEGRRRDAVAGGRARNVWSESVSGRACTIGQ